MIVIEASLFWALVLGLAGFLWLGSGILAGIEALFHSPKSSAAADFFSHRASLRGQISLTLVVVLAILIAGVSALAFEWRRAQSAKRHPAVLSRHHISYVASPAPNP